MDGVKLNILIVEDQFIEANNLQLILERAGYLVCGIAQSVPAALKILETESPDLVLLDIQLQGKLTGIDLAVMLRRKNIAFVYLSANSNKSVLAMAKETRPYGFLVKPFRERDVLVCLDVALYLHNDSMERKAEKELSGPTHLLKEEFSSVIGRSQAMVEVFKSVKIVAPSETSVLILGESGTGKEKIAECINELSTRRNKPFIKVNCAALPPNLIESELFGHEKGAFTGAYEKRAGKFELADGGTLFLDEIGELTTDMQVKFLRVLQEKEIEVVGGKTKKVNVRVIAATNRKLEDELATGRFRLDLYYRLNVFPIQLPALKDRKEDLPLLIEHFLSLMSKKLGKVVKKVTPQLLAAMQAYHWPGNVRELENLIERGVLTATGDTITEMTLASSEQPKETTQSEQKTKTMEENEREHIIGVLKQTAGRIYGHKGAAEILDMNPSTLNSRIKKLNIRREKYEE